MGTGGALCLSVSTFSQIALFNSSKSSAPEPYEPLLIFYSRQRRYRLLARPPAYSGHIQSSSSNPHQNHALSLIHI